jgi:hypothetical protein
MFWRENGRPEGSKEGDEKQQHVWLGLAPRDIFIDTGIYKCFGGLGKQWKQMAGACNAAMYSPVPSVRTLCALCLKKDLQ